jgi:hypothetical protein
VFCTAAVPADEDNQNRSLPEGTSSRLFAPVERPSGYVIRGAAYNLAEQEQKRIKSGSARRAARFMGDITETSWCDGK